MIDIHCHILPGLDDGVEYVEESLEMAKTAARNGIHTIIATPHHANGRYENPAKDINALVHQFNNLLQAQQIPVKVLAGQEIRINNRLIDELMEKTAMPLNQGNYILIELPNGSFPDNLEELFHELRVFGLIPIISHPERYRSFMEEPDRLYSLIEQGAMSQITDQSLIGLSGRRIQKNALKLCKRHLVHFIASDAHNLTTRSFHLREAYEYIQQKLGQEYTQYFQSNAQSLVDNQPI
ncbi:MAG TPA: CpsB/CapC family capsule biosynthesis tyrosine phosphatase, partial [Bacilli bacterium]